MKATCPNCAKELSEDLMEEAMQQVDLLKGKEDIKLNCPHCKHPLLVFREVNDYYVSGADKRDDSDDWELIGKA